jgi:hypothetical protein
LSWLTENRGVLGSIPSLAIPKALPIGAFDVMGDPFLE